MTPVIGLPQAVISGGVTVLGAITFLRGFRDLRRRRLIANTPTAKIRSMAMGLVEINGSVEPRSLVTAPFSGRPCVYWQVDVALQGRRNTWTTVHHNSSGHPFFVRDSTGLALIYPRGAECRVSYGVEETCAGLTLPDVYAEYLSDQALPMRHLWRFSTMRFRERTLEEGQSVYVLGTATPRAPELVVSEGEELAATGTDGDVWNGRVRRRDAESHAVVRMGENEKVFVISQTPERDLNVLLGLKAVAQLAGGPLLTIGGLVFLIDAVR